MTTSLFAFTLFCSAALLFVVQPMAGKTLLPQVGGTPAVWSACLLFFQAVLLAGYFYADRLGRMREAWRVPLHLGVVGIGLLAAFLLRPQLDWIPDDREYPILGLLLFLAAMVGVPFFVLSCTAPLLQRWYSQTDSVSARDPYFLYAASNAGSLLGLLGYPFLVEPRLDLVEQRDLWRLGFALFAGMLFLCGLWMKRCSTRRRTSGDEHEEDPQRVSDNPSALTANYVRPLSWSRWGKWVLLAAIPSSWLMSVTTHLTTDVAPVPLLWVVPLALYLAGFVIVFAKWGEAARFFLGRLTPMLLLFLCVALLTNATEPIAIVVILHLAAFLAVTLLCLGELAHDRPEHQHLTTFYLALSLGGVLGGVFNAILAPWLFSSLGLIEYPLAIVAVSLIRPEVRAGLAPISLTKRDLFWIAGFVVLTLALAWWVPQFVELPTDLSSPDALIPRLVRAGLMYGIPAVVAFALVARPARFACCVAVLLLSGYFDIGTYGRTLLISRNFFGTLRVVESSDGRFVRLVHGTTLHGQQWKNHADPTEPLMYYHRRGPIGRFLETMPTERRKRVAVVGLGCGALASYAEPGEKWTFFEIDPAVERIARDTRYFTFLQQCRGDWEVVLGDARRKLDSMPDGHFDFIILDAFSSDAIPVHLLTREAFALYSRKLSPRGVLAFHLSNRYLDLPPLVARLGNDQPIPWAMWLNEDLSADSEQGRFPSVWAVLARDLGDLGDAAKNVAWRRLSVLPGPIWTDDFSNLLSVWKRDEE